MMLSLYKASAEAAVFRGRDGGFRKTAHETAETAETAEIRQRTLPKCCLRENAAGHSLYARVSYRMDAKRFFSD